MDTFTVSVVTGVVALYVAWGFSIAPMHTGTLVGSSGIVASDLRGVQGMATVVATGNFGAKLVQLPSSTLHLKLGQLNCATRDVAYEVDGAEANVRIVDTRRFVEFSGDRLWRPGTNAVTVAVRETVEFQLNQYLAMQCAPMRPEGPTTVDMHQLARNATAFAGQQLRQRGGIALEEVLFRTKMTGATHTIDENHAAAAAAPSRAQAALANQAADDEEARRALNAARKQAEVRELEARSKAAVAEMRAAAVEQHLIRIQRALGNESLHAFLKWSAIAQNPDMLKWVDPATPPLPVAAA